MFAFGYSKVVALAIGLLPQGPGGQLHKLPTPAAVKQEITERLLANYRRSLAATVEARQKLEKQRDENPKFRESYTDLIARFKEIEASDQRRIESLERGRLAPPTETFRPR